MGLRSWLRRACDSVWNMLVEYGAIAVGPLPGVNYPDAEPGHGNGDRLQDPRPATRNGAARRPRAGSSRSCGQDSASM